MAANEALHERARAVAAFALVLALAISGVDSVVTGAAPDWASGAAAASEPAQALSPPMRALPVAAEPPPPAITTFALADVSVAHEDLLGAPEASSSNVEELPDPPKPQESGYPQAADAFDPFKPS